VTTFVTGGTGFIGSAVVAALVAAGEPVQALTRSSHSAAAVRQLGAEPVPGDLVAPGDWQRQVRAAGRVVHAAQPATFGGRLTAKVGQRYRADRLVQDRALLDALDPTSRLVYLSGNSYFGQTGPDTARDETMDRHPTGFGPYVQDAVAEVRRRIDTGLDAVVAFPGAVYGDGAWLAQYTLTPLRAGKPVYELGGRRRRTSPIAVTDVARAVTFLTAQPAEAFSDVGRLLFLVDDQPLTFHEINQIAAASLDLPARYRRVPAPLMRLLAGQVGYEYLATDAVYSNARLSSLGFQLEHPSAHEGIPALLATHESTG